MRAYEVDKDGNAIVYIVVPHDSDALESQGAYRMIPMRTVAGEGITVLPTRATATTTTAAAAGGYYARGIGLC